MIGFTYPLAIDSGGVDTTGDYSNLVAGAIVSSLNTRTEERVFRPEYGLDMDNFQTVNNLVDVLASLRQTIESGLEGYPEVSFELFGSIGELGQVDLQVVYVCPDGLERSVEVTI